jgi:L-seryl-tRNA(Ser) seleniumtransferase
MTDASIPSSEALNEDALALYTALGARPVINAAGAYTVLGGSRLSPGVRQAMADANRHYADMKSLIESSGEVIAGLLGAEAAMVTSGAAGALTLSAAACLTREHPELLERLPDTEDMPNEILTQRRSRQKYDRCVEFSGARLVEYGDQGGTTAEQLRTAITPRTAALHYFVPPQEMKGLLPLETVIEVGHERGLPVIVDAAGRTWPLDELKRYARAGADLVCYAAKYFDAPHSTGMIVGRKALVELAMTNSFIGFETSGYLTVGRPMKVDRQEIFAVVVALQEWLAMDHEARLLRYGERSDQLLTAVKDVENVEDAYRISERETPTPVVRDGVRLLLKDAEAARGVSERLRDGDPCVWVGTNGRAINVSVAFCSDEESEVVVRRVREELHR